MSRSPNPYLKCEKRDGLFHLTLMRSTGRALILAGRATVPVGDGDGLKAAVEDLMAQARLANTRIGVQADGNS